MCNATAVTVGPRDKAPSAMAHRRRPAEAHNRGPVSRMGVPPAVEQVSGVRAKSDQCLAIDVEFGRQIPNAAFSIDCRDTRHCSGLRTRPGAICANFPTVNVVQAKVAYSFLPVSHRPWARAWHALPAGPGRRGQARSERPRGHPAQPARRKSNPVRTRRR
ncbi:MAG: hypothetical protein JWQ73_2519 [Variovorax sp.]|nr:hypothetical protein [Variovorax sp.]